MFVIWLQQVGWRQMKPRTFFWVLFGLIFSGLLAALVSIVVLGLLSYSFVISIGLPAAQRATPLATIATGIALFTVAALAYLLQRRSHELQRQSYVALHEPSLGIHWKDPVMLPSTEIATKEKSDVYAEHVMWNAGDVPIVIRQPVIVRIRGLGPVDFGKGITQLERVQGSKLILEQSFPIVLGKAEVCIWRQFTGDAAHLRPTMSKVCEVNREEAKEFLRDQKSNRHFLFAVTYFSKPPADLTESDLHRQYVGFSYTLSGADGKARRTG